MSARSRSCRAVLGLARRLVPLLALGLLGAACSREPPTPAERGRSSFVRNCSACHGVDGTGTLPRGVSLATPPRDLTDPAFHAERSDEQLLFVLRNGKGSMPPFGVLFTPEQLQDLVAYVRTLNRGAALGASTAPEPGATAR